jgi:hypothetical protein
MSRTSHGAPQFLSGRGSSGISRATIGTTSAIAALSALTLALVHLRDRTISVALCAGLRGNAPNRGALRKKRTEKSLATWNNFWPPHIFCKTNIAKKNGRNIS